MRDDPPPPLSPRLSAVAALVPRGSRVADVGTDHALLAAWLVRSGVATWCIASDRDAAAIARAGRRPEVLAAGDRIELRVGDGLAVLAPEDRVDVLVVAGLGGESISRLADPAGARLLGIRRIVLQPQTRGAEVRRLLRDRGLAIADERVAEDRGRYYVAIAAEPGTGTERLAFPGLDEEDVLTAGPVVLARAPEAARAYWRSQRDRLARLAGRARRGLRDAAAERLARAERILAALGG